MKPVAVINGVPVYSDKKLSAIINAKVTFADGSYADVKTGEVLNLGKGYISIGNNPKNITAEEIISVNKKFTANKFEARDVFMDISIQPYNGKEISVSAKGAESDLEDLIIREEQGVVVIKGKDKKVGGGMTVISGGSSITIGGGISNYSIVDGISVQGNTVINVGGVRNKTQIEVLVPKKTAINIFRVDGKVNIGNVNGPLRLHIKGQNEVNAGSITKVFAKVSGTGNVNIATVKGDVSLEVSGTGSVTIKGGEIGELDASVKGTGRIDIYAKAETADLNVSGVGQVYVLNVVKRPSRNVSGVGRIEVGNW